MNKAIYITLILVLLTAVSISSGCVSPAINDANSQNSILTVDSPDQEITNDSSIDKEVEEKEASSIQKFVIPKAMPRGEYYDFTDDTRDNKLKVTVVKNTGKKISSVDILDPSLDERVTLTPEPGNVYYYLFVSYTHSGLRSLDQPVQTVTTPSIAFHRLYDADGNMYRPLQLNVRYTYSFYGKYYQPTILERMNTEKDIKTFEGYLIYEVPSDFTSDGAYLTIKLGKWGTPAWKLWE